MKLRTKVFLLFVSLIAVVQGASLWTVYQANLSQEQQQLEYRINSAVSVFQMELTNRLYYLSAFSETAAKDFGLKQAFGEDTRSFLVALNNHRRRIQADLAIAIDPVSFIKGQLVYDASSEGKKVRIGPQQGERFGQKMWLEDQTQRNLYQLDGELYQLSIAPLKSGSAIIGWVGFGYRLDQPLAASLAELTRFNIDFMLRNSDNMQARLLASATPTGELPQHTYGDRILAGENIDDLITATEKIGETGNSELYVTIYGSRAGLIQSIRESWQHLVTLESVIVLLALFGAYYLANSITRPIRRLVHQAKDVAGGHYDKTVVITESNELGQLANEFNLMQQAVLEREKAITHRALHDPLTEMPNRNFLIQQAESGLVTPDSALSLFHIDIQRTKAINDTLGYELGNSLIREVGERLRSLPDLKSCVHLGADEFVLLVAGNDDESIEGWHKRIAELMDTPLDCSRIQLHIQLTMGVSRSPDDANNIHQLLQYADTALSHAKAARKQIQSYQAEMDADLADRLSLVNELKTAIVTNQLQLFYQPKLDLKSDKIHQLEALVRWQHPERGMIPPDAFISIAEQTGLIDSLTHWVVDEAASQYQRWSEKGLDLTIAVNISAENLKNANFPQELKGVWQRYNLPDHAISLEVTESAVVSDPESAVAMLCEIRDTGIKLSIDDYGTGYSSLAQLKQLPVHELKIDRSFVDQLCHNTDDRIIVQSTIRLAHDMGLTVVAEGIEDAQTLSWLREYDCDLAQGYYISRPLPAQEFEQWLANSEHPPRRAGNQ